MGCCLANHREEEKIIRAEPEDLRQVSQGPSTSRLCPWDAPLKLQPLFILNSPSDINHSLMTPSASINFSADIVNPVSELGVGVVPLSEVALSPKLLLEIISSSSSIKGSAFVINARGYSKSLRKCQDGYVFVGSKLTRHSSEEIINDIVLSSDEVGLGQRHFAIKYSAEKRMYYLLDLGEGTGTFIKINRTLFLQKGYIISYGDTHMLFNILQNGEAQIRFLEGSKSEQVFTFDAKGVPYKIGRMPDCAVIFDDSSVSRYQCTLFQTLEGWTIADGDGTNKSRNGTWLFADQFFPLLDGSIFKAGQSLYRVSLLL